MNILDILFPRRCLYCLKGGSYICNKCIRQFQPSLPECFYCRRLSNYYKSHTDCNNFSNYKGKNASVPIIKNVSDISFATYLFRYNESAKILMKEAKFNGAFDIFRNLDDLISLGLEKRPLFLDPNHLYTIIPAPQHRRRYMKRGFQQTEIVAESFVRVLTNMGYKVLIDNHVVRKKVNNKRQASLSREERLINTEGVYEIDVTEIRSMQRIILVDDVITTGSTLESLGKEVKKVERSVEVSALALFRGRASYGDDV